MSNSPTQPRIEIIDILRGFTLLGIIIVHFAEQYYAGMHPESHVNFTSKFLGDDIMMGFIGIFISGKFYMIFSFLFGLSFFLQLKKSDSSVAFFGRFLWRLIVLLAIGFVHHLHYRGDILTIYAMLGVGLLICFKLPDKFLLILALALIINLPSAVVRGVAALNAPVKQNEEQQNPFAGNNEDNEKYFNTVKSGSYQEVLKANFYEFEFKYRFQVESGRIYITMGLFLLGLYVGRKRIFENWQLHLTGFKKYLKRSLWTILGLILFAAAFFGGAELMKLKMPDVVQWMVGGLVFDVFNLALAMIYVAGIVLLFQKEKWKPRLMQFYAVGRMGLTTYLMQTFFGVLLFFGIGFGLLGEIGALTSVAIALVIFTGQIYFSKWWLTRYRYGFFEWLWRSATYLKIQPFRNS
ncbi:MAG: DUF418 domain-containing protein [Cyclobacteriaceae bacterium]|nr:DUF418 domain-containing protein [Cyclobacteriaceae bacterium]